MIGTAAAIGIAGIGAAGSVAGGLINKSATDKATSAQVQAQREAMAFQEQQAKRAEEILKEQAAIARKDLEPFREVEISSLRDLRDLTDPNNALAVQERELATKHLQRQLAAQGLLRSRKQTRGLADIEMGLASQRAQRLGMLSNMGASQQAANISQNLGGGLASLYNNLGSQVGSGFQNMGNSVAQGHMAGAQATTGAISGVGNAISGLSGSLLQLKLMRDMGFLKS